LLELDTGPGRRRGDRRRQDIDLRLGRRLPPEFVTVKTPKSVSTAPPTVAAAVVSNVAFDRVPPATPRTAPVVITPPPERSVNVKPSLIVVVPAILNAASVVVASVSMTKLPPTNTAPVKLTEPAVATASVLQVGVQSNSFGAGGHLAPSTSPTPSSRPC
jgi:hypothetical protein